jgi:XisH protein
MPKRDLFHDAVKNALVKEGWTITDDPFKLDFGFTNAFVDLGAEKLLAAEKNKEKIAVEIKSFVGSSELYEFHTALGQFLNYQAVLKRDEPERILFLAVPSDTYETFFKHDLIDEIIQIHSLRIIVYNPNKEEIEQWIK